jgi:hypothetical protein
MFAQQQFAPSELERLLAALSDRRPRVAHGACAVLEAQYVVPRELLWALLARARRSHTRACVVRLLARGERIDSMTWLLNAIALGDRAVREQACRHLMRWGEVWPPVTPQRIAEFRVALTRASATLPAPLREQLWAFVHHVDGTSPRVKQTSVAAHRASVATPASKASRLVAPVKAPVMEPLMSPLMALAKASALRKAALVAKVDMVAPEPVPLRLPGCVVRRRYELPPRRRAPWRWMLS